MNVLQTETITEIMGHHEILSITTLCGVAYLELRDGGTVRVYSDGSQRWFMNDKLHRTDGPASAWAGGDQYWYQDGMRHRTDGPAALLADGSQFWYQNNVLHRTDGPAEIRVDGTQRWYLNGEKQTAYTARKSRSISTPEV